MANVKKKWVAFKGNLTIPAAMVGKKEDQKVQSGEGVQVLAFYADSVVQDGIAEYSDASAKGPKVNDGDPDALAKKEIQRLEGELQTANNRLADAESDVTSLNLKLQTSTEEVDALKEKLSEVQGDLRVAEGLLAEGERSAAEAAVTDAQAALDAAEGTNGVDAARAALLAAQEALAALQD